MQCVNQLKLIALALRNYENRYQCLPPPCIYDKTGRPMHSWRVLILPFVDHERLYGQYDFNEPWDGPSNRKLLASRPSEYVCPSEKMANLVAKAATTTSYLAVVGSRAAWQQHKRTSLNDPELRKQMDETVLLIETANSGVAWTEPRDFSLDDPRSNQSDSVSTIQGPHMQDNGYFYYKTPMGFNAMLATGRTHFLFAGHPAADKLRPLLAVGGFTEENAATDIAADKQEPEINWWHGIGLPVWLVSVGLLLYRSYRSRKAPLECGD